MNDHDARHLDTAARLAWRGRGGVEPNPMVGCVIVAPDGEIVGWGYHRRCGEPHAEVEALRRAAGRTRGATVYVTLEPCAHTGRTGPCVDELIAAGITRVVYGQPDPHPVSGGGRRRLLEAAIDVTVYPEHEACALVGRPFLHRIRHERPWVIAKWAQTIDGRIATRTGESKWISNTRSRSLVHRERGMVDAILTGIGTVTADDPRLTARTRRPRRLPRRIVVDPALELSPECALVRTATETPTIVACTSLRANSAAADGLRAAGVTLLATAEEAPGEIDLHALLRRLHREHDISTVLVESGPGLLGRLFRDRLVDAAWVFVAPSLFGDADAIPAVRGLTVETLTAGVGLELRSVRRRDDDVILGYLVSSRHFPVPRRRL